ncbi:MAG: hypothetical protein JNK26_04360, partial [Candidatus Doudnabacteria bacterium]|nr:hypothetical protein [Candidatus Doudnabacteria bacterium]
MTKKIITSFTFALFLLFFSFHVPVSAVEYGGLGGKPAYPDPDNPRTSS